MTHITFTLTNIQRLNSIKVQLANKCILTAEEREYLLDFLDQVPTPDASMLENILSSEPLEIRVWEVDKIERVLGKWYDLFINIPGFDFSPAVNIIDQNSDPKLFYKNIIMTASFSPTLSHNEFIDSEPFEIHLKDDRTASFWFPILKMRRDFQIYSISKGLGRKHIICLSKH